MWTTVIRQSGVRVIARVVMLMGAATVTAEAGDAIPTLQRSRVDDSQLSAIQSLKISTKGKFYVFREAGQPKVYLCDLHTGKLLKKCNHSLVSDVATSPDGRLIAMSGHDLAIWSPRDAVVRILNKGLYEKFGDVQFSRDGCFVAAVGDGCCALRIWDVASGKRLSSIKGHRYLVTSFSFSPAGEHLVSGDGFGNLFLWSVRSGRLLSTIRKGTGRLGVAGKLGISGDIVRSVRYSPKGDRIYALTYKTEVGQHIEIWKPTEGKAMTWVRSARLSVGAKKQTPKAMEVTSDGRRLVVCHDDGTGIVIGLDKLRPIARFGEKRKATERSERGILELTAPRDYFRELAVSGDGKLLAVGYDDGRIVFWKLP